MNKLSIAKKLISLNNWLIKEGHEEGAFLYPFVESIIVKEAGRLSDAKGEHPDKADLLDDISSRLNEVGLQRYLGWALEELIDSEFTEDPDKLIRILKLWERSKARPEVKEKIKDINNWGADSLDKFLSHLPPTEREKREAAKDRRNAESDIIYNSEKYKVILPKTQFASCQWTGNSTRWCVSAKDGNMFDDYSRRNHLLYHILVKDPSVPDKGLYKRIAIPTQAGAGLMHDELRDSDDELITEEKIKEIIGEEWEAIKAATESDSKAKGFSPDFPEKTRKTIEKIRAGEDISYEEFRSLLRSEMSAWDRPSPILKKTLSEAVREGHPLIRHMVYLKETEQYNFELLDEIFTEANIKDAASLSLYLFKEYPELFGDEEKAEAAIFMLKNYLAQSYSNDSGQSGIMQIHKNLDFLLESLDKTERGRETIKELENQILYSVAIEEELRKSKSAKSILEKTWEYTDTYPMDAEERDYREWKKRDWQDW